MVQGCASNVGKSLLVTGLCRYFADQGLRVAPFKAQNMALNSFATPEGLEIGRAQAVQAAAARVPPTVDMNPVLLTPRGDVNAQVVVMGKPAGTQSAQEYFAQRASLGSVVAASLQRLRQRFDLVVIEGAGSPAEINLREGDIVNMYAASLCDAPVLLVGDIDRGGVFASIVGTLALLQPDERRRVVALVINKFRGDLALLRPGLAMLEERTQRPVLGVLPYLHELGIAEEDSVALEERKLLARDPDKLDLCVVAFPHLSNYDDFLPLEREPSAVVRYVDDADAVRQADLVILPGSKQTVDDLAWLRDRGIDTALQERARDGSPVLGICAGYQMLGVRLRDPHGVENQGEHEGLGLLPTETEFHRDKLTRQVELTLEPCMLTDGRRLSTPVPGYEIHMGRVCPLSHGRPLGHIAGHPEGCVSSSGTIVGTLVHGLFDADAMRGHLLRNLWARRGMSPPSTQHTYSPSAAYDRLTAALTEALDLDRLHALVNLPRNPQ